ncbi:MAG: family transcriptional regulator [Evtepia sp.]|jgi:transcriptional regulator with XRE-family HTH domain|nr:family transcriptional regulator [Evtepia sp.]
MNERIKELRKALKLSQDEFGRKLGVTRGAITNIELNKTEPKPLFAKHICEVFDVSEDWLLTAQGDMFLHLDKDEEFDRICAEIELSDDDFIKNLLRSYWALEENEKAVIRKLMNGLVENM